MNALLERFNVRLVGSVRPFSKKASPDIVHCRVLTNATYSPWVNDPAFVSLYERVRANTLVDVYRCDELWQLARQLDRVNGDFLEVGVWRGGTGAILAKAAETTQPTVYLADTFTGVVKAGSEDPRYVGGEHADTSEEIVTQLMRDLSLSNVEILKGILPDATSARVSGPLALLHCDVDVYESSKDIFDRVLPRLVVDGVIVFDDYGFSGAERVTRLVNDFRSRDDLFLFTT